MGARKIYTKTGDDGTTGLVGNQRVPKDALRVEVYGTIDEANSVLGLALAAGAPEELARVLLDLQARLFDLGADLATPRSDRPDPPCAVGPCGGGEVFHPEARTAPGNILWGKR